MPSDWTLAIVIMAISGATTIGVICLDAMWRAPKLPPRPTVQKLEHDADEVADTVTAEFLLAETRSQLERRTTAMQSVDTRISQFLTIVGGGAGIIAVASLRQDAVPHPPPLVIAGGVTLLMVLTLCVVSAIPRNRVSSDLRGIADYNKTSFVGNSANKGILAHELIVRYANLSDGVRVSTRKKRWYYVAASSLFVLALATVLATFVKQHA